jgi:hypothetical protein
MPRQARRLTFAPNPETLVGILTWDRANENCLEYVKRSQKTAIYRRTQKCLNELLDEQEVADAQSASLEQKLLQCPQNANRQNSQSLPEGGEMVVEEEGLPRPSAEDLNDEEDNEDEDEILYPPSCNYLPGSVEDFTEKMRFNGLTWRQEVKKRVKKDPNLKRLLQWVNSRPSSMDEPTHTLGQMLHDIKDIPHSEVGHIADMGDGYVQMPTATFERYVYPSAFLRSYLENMRSNNLPGGTE